MTDFERGTGGATRQAPFHPRRPNSHAVTGEDWWSPKYDYSVDDSSNVLEIEVSLGQGCLMRLP